MYLCTRKSAHCAGYVAIKALKKSDLVFEKGRCSSFLYVCALTLRGGKMTLMQNETIILLNNIIIKF